MTETILLLPRLQMLSWRAQGEYLALSLLHFILNEKLGLELA